MDRKTVIKKLKEATLDPISLKLFCFTNYTTPEEFNLKEASPNFHVFINS